MGMSAVIRVGALVGDLGAEAVDLAAAGGGEAVGVTPASGGVGVGGGEGLPAAGLAHLQRDELARSAGGGVREASVQAHGLAVVAMLVVYVDAGGGGPER